MNEIVHKAKIVKIYSDALDVEIEAQSACSACALQKACSLSEVAHKIVHIETQNPQNYTKGQEVDITLDLKDGQIALLFGYILPLMLVLFTLFLCVFCGLGELSSGICSIIVLIPYYFGLSFKKDFFKKKFCFRIVNK